MLVKYFNYIKWLLKAEIFIKINNYLLYTLNVKRAFKKALYSENKIKNNKIKFVFYSSEIELKFYKRISNYEDN